MKKNLLSLPKDCSTLFLKLYLVILLSNGPFLLLAQKESLQRNQTFSCATPKMTEEQRSNILANKDHFLSSNKNTACIPIRVHILRKTDGTEGIDLTSVNIGIAQLNASFKDAYLEFYICSINYIDSTEWFNFDSVDENAMTSLPGNFSDDALNLYYANSLIASGRVVCGYARYPLNTDASLRVFVANYCIIDLPQKVLTHEVGHFFNLLHTHEGTEYGNTSSNAENVPRFGPNANCQTTGDLLCDTEADPDGSNDVDCNFINNGTSSEDIYGNTYTPELENIMSYYTPYCGGVFTSDQEYQMLLALGMRGSHTAYELQGCGPTSVNNPSNPTGSVNENYQVDLNWVDQSNNETGFLVERSTNGGFTFRAIPGGGVGPDSLALTDRNVEANKTYKYRVKASNDDCNDYSDTLEINVGLIYCTPTNSTSSCGAGGIGYATRNFKFSEGGAVLIDNPANGCNGPFSNFRSNHSAAVVAGGNYNVELNFQKNTPPSGSYFPQFASVWMDLNQNGTFTDAGELLYQSTSANGPTLNIPISIPTNALAGNTALRIRSGMEIVNAPCGYIGFSETEDYELIVLTSVPVSLKHFSGQKVDNHVQLTWHTESEINNDYFILEHSNDAIHFQQLAKIKSRGDNSQGSTYQYLDQNPFPGKNYYRLRQIDFDGQQNTFAQLVVIEFPSQRSFSIFPNPVMDQYLRFSFSDARSGQLNYEILNTLGSIVSTGKMQAEETGNYFELPIDQLHVGVYFLRVQKAEESQILRFVKRE